MKYPKYVYFPLGGFVDEWWKEFSELNSSCSSSLIAKMINGSGMSLVPKGYFPYDDGVHNTTSGEVLHQGNLFFFLPIQIHMHVFVH